MAAGQHVLFQGRLQFILLFLFCCGWHIPGCAALTCYIDPVNGNDGNSGASPATALLTLLQAYNNGCDLNLLLNGTFSGASNRNLGTVGMRDLQYSAVENGVIIDLEQSPTFLRARRLVFTGITMINGLATADKDYAFELSGFSNFRQSTFRNWNKTVDVGNALVNTDGHYVHSALINLESCLFENIHVEYSSTNHIITEGGIWAGTTSNFKLIQNSTFINVQLITTSTSAIIQGGALYGTEFLIENCVFQNCAANSFVVGPGSSIGEGGAVMLPFTGTVNITNSRFIGNSAIGGDQFGFGGAIGTRSPTPELVVRVTNCNFALNSVNGNGGAIFRNEPFNQMGNVHRVQLLGGSNTFCNNFAPDSSLVADGLRNQFGNAATTVFSPPSLFQCHVHAGFSGPCTGCVNVNDTNVDGDDVCSLCDCDDTDAAVQFIDTCDDCVSQTALNQSYDVCDNCGQQVEPVTCIGCNGVPLESPFPPCPTITATPSPSPTISPSPTPTASATPTVSPTPTPTPAPVCDYSNLTLQSLDGGQYGEAVSICGETGAVAARQEFFNSSSSGAVHIYSRFLGGNNAWGELTVVGPPDGGNTDEFGTSISLFNVSLLVGAPQSPTGGAVYLFGRDEGGVDNWGFQQKLTFVNATVNDRFGTGVQLGASMAIVGNPTQTILGNFAAGAAFLYTKLSPTGPLSFLKLLIAPDFTTAAAFGRTVSIDDVSGVVVVGAPNLDGLGAAYIFRRDAGGVDNWGFVLKLNPPGVSPGDPSNFGAAVSIQNLTLAVSNYQQEDGLMVDTGFVYIYQRSTPSSDDWTLIQTRSGTGTGASFGFSLSLNGPILLVGEPGFNSDTGRTHVLVQDIPAFNEWGRGEILSQPTPGTGNNFGSAVALDADTLFVGAPQTDIIPEVIVFRTAVSTCVAPELCPFVAPTLTPTPSPTPSPSPSPSPTPSPSPSPTATPTPTNTPTATITPTVTPTATPTPTVTPTPQPVCNYSLTQTIEQLGNNSGTPFFNNQYGSACSFCGGYSVVGAPLDYSPSSGFQDDTGVVFLYAESAGGWQQIQVLEAPNAAAGDQFGFSVSLFDDVVAVGAPLHDGVQAAEGNAYVFVQNIVLPNDWELVKILNISSPDLNDQFGDSVAAAANYVLVGAPQRDISGFMNSGAAYLFARNEGGSNNWGQIKELVAPDLSSGARFGSAVAIDENLNQLVVGAEGALPFGDGAAYVFGRDVGGANNWGLITKIIPEIPTPATFGAAVALRNRTLVVGDPAFEFMENVVGAAFFYDRNGNGTNSWSFSALKMGELDTDSFGSSVALSSDSVAAVGAPGSNNPVSNTGIVQLYGRDVGGAANWGIAAIVFNPNSSTGSTSFGSCVALDQDTLFGGAPSTAVVSSLYIFETGDSPCIAPAQCNVTVCTPLLKKNCTLSFILFYFISFSLV